MKVTPAKPEVEGSGSTSKPVLRLVIVYEDAVTFRRAGMVGDWLEQKFGREVELKIVCWKLDPFIGQKLLEMAVADASAAHLVILSLHGDTMPPAGVMAWVELWLRRGPGTASLLVALLDGLTEGTKNNSPIHSYLRAAARAANIDFISETAEPCDGMADDGTHVAGDRWGASETFPEQTHFNDVQPAGEGCLSAAFSGYADQPKLPVNRKPRNFRPESHRHPADCLNP